MKISAELNAAVQRLKARTWQDASAQAFEQGAIPTKAATQDCAAQPVVRANHISRFLPRRRQHSPDRKASRDRRRMLGGSSALPETLRHHFTEGQRAVLCVIAGEVKRTGTCDFPIDKIAALAGVCRTTVQNTLHEARRLALVQIIERPQRGRKSLTNIIKIVSAEWRTWLVRGPSASHGIGSKSLKTVSPTKSILKKKERKCLGDEVGSGHGPPRARWRGAA